MGSTCLEKKTCRQVPSWRLVRGDAEDRLLYPEEAAELIAVSKRQVSDMARRGQLHCVPVGRFVRSRRQDVDEWFEENIR
jgi:excisionase family DNA binding protein